MLEEATLCVGCGLNCVIHQKEKDKQRPGRPSTVHIELVLQVVVLVPSSEAATHLCCGRELEESSTLPREGRVGHLCPTLLGLSGFRRTAERHGCPSIEHQMEERGRRISGIVHVKIDLSSLLDVISQH